MPEQQTPATGGRPETRRRHVDLLIVLGVLALWIILQVWVLPKAGVPT